jgi:hypothetical protein
MLLYVMFLSLDPITEQLVGSMYICSGARHASSDSCAQIHLEKDATTTWCSRPLQGWPSIFRRAEHTAVVKRPLCQYYLALPMLLPQDLLKIALSRLWFGAQSLFTPFRHRAKPHYRHIIFALFCCCYINPNIPKDTWTEQPNLIVRWGQPACIFFQFPLSQEPGDPRGLEYSKNETENTLKSSSLWFGR